jgi:hypothetical protein
MKVIHHVPTEQYGFTEIETDESMTYEEAKLVALGKHAGPGLSEADFRVILDKYMLERTLTAEEYEAMNAVQQNIIQCLKRAYKRQAND